MADLTPQEIADKQVKRASAATADYRKGVRSVKEAPNAKAARAKTKYLAGVQQSADDGTYEANNNAVSLGEWQDAADTKGGNNYAKGVEYAKPKIVAFQEQFTPVRRAARDAVRAMPNDTYEERKARANENMDRLHQFRYRRRSRA